MNSDYNSDQLLSSFKLLWNNLYDINDGVLLAGGYGLFLKQRWLQENPEIKSLIPLSSWKDGKPRVTMDIDLIIQLDLIASKSDQNKIRSILDKLQYTVVPGNELWQYEKHTNDGKKIVVDFHAPLPRHKRTDINVTSRRVKPSPSMKGCGIHGRLNPEAICCDLKPVSFNICNLKIAVPNTFTMVVMKLAAMRDRWQSSQAEKENYGKYQFQLNQAIKHGRDILRAVAMLTRDEYDEQDVILNEIKTTPAFSDATKIFNDLFFNDKLKALLSLESYWEHKQIIEIEDFLKQIFSSV